MPHALPQWDPTAQTVTVAPPLPVVVELYEPYYVYKNYHYVYNGERWYYSSSKTGPWIDLPRDRYPREIRHTGPVYDRDREGRQGKGDDRRWKDDQRGGKDPGWKDDKGRAKIPSGRPTGTGITTRAEATAGGSGMTRKARTIGAGLKDRGTGIDQAACWP